MTWNWDPLWGVLHQTEITQGFQKEERRHDKKEEAPKEILRKSEEKLSTWQFGCLLPCV